MEIKDLIKSKKPELSESSIKTYSFVVKSLNKRMYGDDKIDVERFRKDKAKIIEDMSNQKPNVIRTALSALILLTGDEDFRSLLNKKIKEQKEALSNNEMNDKQKENWVSEEDIKKKLEELRKQANVFYKKKSLTPQELQRLQDYIILAIMGGVYIAPRRSLDFTEMMIDDLPKNKNNVNYIDNGSFVFNVYKTAKTYGEQKLKIPLTLKNIIKKWKTKNPTDYLFFDIRHNKLTPIKLNQRLNSIFDGKKVGSTALRRTYLTEKYEETINEMKDLSEDMKKMGSSKNQVNHYVKNTDKNI
jgi:hypothetical protein